MRCRREEILAQARGLLARVYAGGLTKFEPSEAMRILVPVELAS